MNISDACIHALHTIKLPINFLFPCDSICIIASCSNGEFYYNSINDSCVTECPCGMYGDTHNGVCRQGNEHKIKGPLVIINPFTFYNKEMHSSLAKIASV